MKRALLLIGALALSACAEDGVAGTSNPGSIVDGTVEVSMTDMAFNPTSLKVTKGQAVTFKFTNEGAVKHEAIIGTLAEQDEHHVEMAAAAAAASTTVKSSGHDMDTMSGHDMETMSGHDMETMSGHDMETMSGHDMGTMSGHDMGTMAGHDMAAVTVEPGDTLTITHTFDKAGEFYVGCHQPGHWEAGMKMTIDVA